MQRIQSYLSSSPLPRFITSRMASSSAVSATQGADRINAFGGVTVWHEFTPLSQRFNSVNMGQGFPNWSTPEFVKKACVDAIMQGNQNQYTRSRGHPRLVNALAKRYSSMLGRPIDAMNDIVITAGATEAMYNTMQGLVNPGDEVIIFEPAFDIYSAQIILAGGTPRYVPLKPSSSSTGSSQDWTFDLEELKAAFNDKTRAIVINTPQNPLGKVFSRAELEQIAALVQSRERVIAISDEVYEYMVYDDAEHIRIATLPGMWERTVTVSSAGKTFSTTGWKIGWAVAPANLISSIDTINQWVVFCVSTPMQEAVATAFEEAEKPFEGHSSYFSWLKAMYIEKRAKMAAALSAAGLDPIIPTGGFFIVAETSNIQIPEEFYQDPLNTQSVTGVMEHDYVFCRFLSSKIGVTAIPPSAFFSEANKAIGARYARFAFCKTDEMLEEASKRLLKLKEFAKKE